MGGHPYWYFVPYAQDPQHALDDLRSRELHSGRYYPVMLFPPFGDDALRAEAPGPKHATIENARAAAAETGTRSILDIERVGRDPELCVATPVEPEQLEEWFGTTQPTRAMVEGCPSVFEAIDRGQAIYFVVYDAGRPTELFFAGYSFD